MSLRYGIKEIWSALGLLCFSVSLVCSFSSPPEKAPLSLLKADRALVVLPLLFDPCSPTEPSLPAGWRRCVLWGFARLGACWVLGRFPASTLLCSPAGSSFPNCQVNGIIVFLFLVGSYFIPGFISLFWANKQFSVCCCTEYKWVGIFTLAWRSIFSLVRVITGKNRSLLKWNILKVPEEYDLSEQIKQCSLS